MGGKRLSFAGITRIRFQGSKQGFSVSSQPNAFDSPSLPLTLLYLRNQNTMQLYLLSKENRTMWENSIFLKFTIFNVELLVSN